MPWDLVWVPASVQDGRRCRWSVNMYSCALIPISTKLGSTGMTLVPEKDQ